MKEWKEVKLGEHIGHKKGFAFKSKWYESKGTMIVRVSDTTSNSIDISSCKYISTELAQNYLDYKLNESDIIIMTVGSWPNNPNSIVGKVVKIPKINNTTLLNQNAVRIRTLDKINQLFLFYKLKEKSFSGYLLNCAQGSANQASITLNDIFNYRINLPPLPEQKAIAEVLSSLDDKIDNLHRQNQTLEQMAETLFRQWFVEEAEEDWAPTSLYDAIELVGGGTPKTKIAEYWNGNIKWLSGGDISSNHKSIIVSAEKSITELGLNNSSAKLLPKFSTIISARGTVGKFCILSEPMAFSQSNYGIKPKLDDCHFFNYLLINHCIQALNSAAYGSVFDTITTNTFKGVDIILPTETEIKGFEKTISPYFLKINNNQTQIRTLEKQRDTLLPKLMSGAIRLNYDSGD